MNVYLNTNDLKFIEEQIFIYRYNIYYNKHIICGFWVFLKSNNEMCMFPCRLQVPVFIIILLLLSWWGKAFLTWRCFAYISGVYCLSCKQDHSSSSMIVTCIYRAWKTELQWTRRWWMLYQLYCTMESLIHWSVADQSEHSTVCTVWL